MHDTWMDQYSSELIRAPAQTRRLGFSISQSLTSIGREIHLYVTPIGVDGRVRVVLEILDRQWRSPLSVDELAGQIGLRLSRLEHLFKSEAHTTIRDFVRERRLVKAAEMIASTLS